MLLQLKRGATLQGAVLGSLAANNFHCCSMERADKIIPAGTYSIELTYSPHFKRAMPLLDGVPGRTDIRIHPANWIYQLEGCIAVGISHEINCLDNSDAAFEPLLKRITAAIDSGESVRIQIT